jgi:hypothetical protein
MPALGYDEFKDHPIDQTYLTWARQYFSDPGSAPEHMVAGLRQVFSDPGATVGLALEDPNVRALLDQGQQAQEAYQRAIGAQRAAAAKNRQIQRKALQYQLDRGLRDNEQARQSGLEGVVNNALQRGIYDSGIRKEGEVEVNREADEFEGDLRQDIELAIQRLQAMAGAENAGYAAQDAAQQAQNALSLEDIEMAATEWWNVNPLNNATLAEPAPAAPMAEVPGFPRFQGLQNPSGSQFGYPRPDPPTNGARYTGGGRRGPITPVGGRY